MSRRTNKEIPEAAEEGRLLSRPAQVNTPGRKGVQRLGLEEGRRDGLLYVPESYRPETPAPLAVMLHGAGGNAQDGLGLLREQADEAGLLLLAPDSRGGTWDVILGGYGPDVAYLDRALAFTFARYHVDPAHLAVGGFSDGASYALSLGIINGKFFSHVVAFSPGFMAPTAQRDTPRIYISHGIKDATLPIDPCSRRLVPALKRAGYDVHYHEFEGGHSIPEEIRREAVEWFMS